MSKLDVARALKHKKSNQNIMSSPSGESKRYIDTNHDPEENHEDNDHM